MKPQIVLMVPLGDAPANTPGYPSQGLPAPPNYPSQGLPGAPAYPSTGPGFPTHPIAPGGQPGLPSQGLPAPPIDPSWGVTPPVDPGYGIPDISQGRPDNTLPLPPESPAQPGQIYPPITELHTKTAMLAWLPGYGHRWVVLDPALQPDQGLPSTPPNMPAQPLPHQSPPRRR